MQRVTISDLADRLGLAKSTVSVALNGRPGVSDETRKKVLGLAAELDWHPSSTARALSVQRAGTVGLVVRRDAEILSTEPFFVRALAGIENELERHSVDLRLRITDTVEREHEIYREWWLGRRVDGFICLDEHVDDPRVPLLESLSAQAVFIGPRHDPGNFPRVCPPERTDMDAAVAYLAGLGHTVIGHLGGPQLLAHESARRTYIRAECARLGLELRTQDADYTKHDGQAAALRMLSAHDRPSAVLVANDLMAIGAIHAARALDLAVPSDVAVLSWDDSFLCQIVEPTLSAVDHAPGALGAAAARLLLACIDGSHPGGDVAGEPGALIDRAST